MDDREIIALFWGRNEEALAAVQEKYGGMMLRLAGRILASPEDAEEAVNDALLDAWQAIPPHKPEHLMPFKAARRFRAETARVCQLYVRFYSPLPAFPPRCPVRMKRISASTSSKSS